MLTWLMPSAYAEALLGDLLEERRLRLDVSSPASVARWYWMQLASSLPVLLWASLYRRSSFLTLGTAVASYLAAGDVVFVLREALSPMTTSTFARTVIDLLLCGVIAMTAAGYVAASIRPGAASLLAVLVLVAMSLMMAFDPAGVPLWYPGTFLVIGSLAPIAGAALSRGWRKA
jgi:hypothetical protein